MLDGVARARRRPRRRPTRSRRVRLCVSGAAAAAGRRSSTRCTNASASTCTTATGSPRRRPSSRRPRSPPSRAPARSARRCPGVEVRLVDADGNDVLDGDPGEILVRGPNVFAGYWNDADATARGARPTAGCTPATSRSPTTTAGSRSSTAPRTSIIVSGFNVYPGRGRSTCSRSTPTSPTSRSIGEPHPRTGETVVAYVVAEAGPRSRSGRAVAARGPPARALQAADARRGRRRAAADVRGQARPARAVVVGRRGVGDARLGADDATTKPA